MVTLLESCDGAVPRLVPLEFDAAGAAVRIGTADADPDLLEGWVVESAEYLQLAESALLRLETAPFDADAANTALRSFHTIKGTAAALGLDGISELAHGAESLLTRMRDGAGPPAPAMAALALRAVDVLAALVRVVGGALAGRPVPEPADYGALLRALAEPEATSASAPSVAAADPPSPPARDDAHAWTRVRTERVERIAATIGALARVHDVLAADAAAAGDATLAANLAEAGRLVRELETLGAGMRTTTLRGTVQKLMRVARDAAARTGKQVAFTAHGEDTEIDRVVADAIADPLVHMVRNAVDHGIEPPAERAAAGKASSGAICLTARREADRVVLTLSDDGRGLNRPRIERNAAARGLLDGRTLSEHDAWELIFAPGLSTADAVGPLSGRGVGMDVVRRAVVALRGRIEIDSRPGRGATFTIQLPCVADGRAAG